MKLASGSRFTVAYLAQISAGPRTTYWRPLF